MASRNRKPQARPAETPRVIALIIVSILIWCYAYDRWDANAWNTPLEYGFEGATSDAMLIHGIATASQRNENIPFGSKTIKALNAPFEAHWEDYILAEEWNFWLPGFLGKLTGVFTGVNLTVLLSQVLAVLALYAAARAVAVDWRLAAGAGLLFGFSRMAFARQVHHLTVGAYWHVPLCLLVCYWIGTGGLVWRSRPFWIAIAVAVLTGWQNAYYTFLFLQLAFFACAFRFLRGDKATSKSGGAVIATALASFASTNLDTLFYRLFNGPNPGAVARNYQWLEYYALKPLDLFVPPPDHNMPLMADLGAQYFSNVMVPGETPPSCYLGLAGIIALGWLVVVTLQRACSKHESALPVETWQVGWISLYSIVGGLNGLAGLLGFQLFRSTNRFSIFILAIVLLFAIRRLSIRCKDAVTLWSITVAAVLIGLWDQMPSSQARAQADIDLKSNSERARLWTNFPPALQDVSATKAVIDSDRTFTKELEKRLPQGAMVFQLPVVDFPESPAPGISSYDHFRPYLYTEKLRFSFGAIKGRPREQWQRQLTGLPLPEIISRLQTYGFAALYVNRRGVKDNGEPLIKALAEMGYTETIYSPLNDLYAVLLKPSPAPALPPSG